MSTNEWDCLEEVDPEIYHRGEGQITPMQILAMSVIERALLDAIGKLESGNFERKKYKKDILQKDAEDFLLRGNSALDWACEVLKIDQATIKYWTKRYLENGGKLVYEKKKYAQKGNGNVDKKISLGDEDADGESVDSDNNFYDAEYSIS